MPFAVVVILVLIIAVGAFVQKSKGCEYCDGVMDAISTNGMFYDRRPPVAGSFSSLKQGKFKVHSPNCKYIGLYHERNLRPTPNPKFAKLSEMAGDK